LSRVLAIFNLDFIILYNPTGMSHLKDAVQGRRFAGADDPKIRHLLWAPTLQQRIFQYSTQRLNQSWETRNSVSVPSNEYFKPYNLYCSTECYSRCTQTAMKLQ